MMCLYTPLPGTWRGQAIRTDFRVVLTVEAMLSDPEVRDGDKPLLLRRLFAPELTVEDALSAYGWFVRCGREPERGETTERDFDFSQDAGEIYASFLALYGMDLFAVEELHWWKFDALLSGAFSADTPLSRKVRLRHADDSDGMKKESLARAKEAVQITQSQSRSDQALDKELRRRLMAGEPIEDLIRGRDV